MKPCIRRRGMEDSLVLCIHSLCILPFWKPWDLRSYYMPPSIKFGNPMTPLALLKLLKVPPETTLKPPKLTKSLK